MTANILTDATHQMFLVDKNREKLCKIFEIDVQGVIKKRSIGDGQFIEELYSVMIVDKPIQPEIKLFGIDFPKHRFTPIVSILSCRDLDDGKYLLTFSGHLEKGEG